MSKAGLVQDKVVVVTGAGGGIGRDIALAMVREGANGLWATNLRAAGRYVTGVSVKDFVWTKGTDGRWRTDWAPLGEGLVPLDQMAAILKEINERLGFRPLDEERIAVLL